jgi:hypothetical protein
MNRRLDRHGEDGHSAASPNGIGMTDAEYYATIQLLQSEPEINQKRIALVEKMENNTPRKPPPSRDRDGRGSETS